MYATSLVAEIENKIISLCLLLLFSLTFKHFFLPERLDYGEISSKETSGKERLERDLPVLVGISSNHSETISSIVYSCFRANRSTMLGILGSSAPSRPILIGGL